MNLLCFNHINCDEDHGFRDIFAIRPLIGQFRIECFPSIWNCSLITCYLPLLWTTVSVNVVNSSSHSGKHWVLFWLSLLKGSSLSICISNISCGVQGFFFRRSILWTEILQVNILSCIDYGFVEFLEDLLHLPTIAQSSVLFIRTCVFQRIAHHSFAGYLIEFLFIGASKCFTIPWDL